jgi:hypothetical protein
MEPFTQSPPHPHCLTSCARHVAQALSVSSICIVEALPGQPLLFLLFFHFVLSTGRGLVPLPTCQKIPTCHVVLSPRPCALVHRAEWAEPGLPLFDTLLFFNVSSIPGLAVVIYRIFFNTFVVSVQRIIFLVWASGSAPLDARLNESFHTENVLASFLSLFARLEAWLRHFYLSLTRGPFLLSPPSSPRALSCLPDLNDTAYIVSPSALGREEETGCVVLEVYILDEASTRHFFPFCKRARTPDKQKKKKSLAQLHHHWPIGKETQKAPP